MAGDRRLVVHLDGRRAGFLEQDHAGRVAFAYDPAYADGSGRTPLSTSMPVGGARYGGRALQNFLWNLLPDSDRTLDRWGRAFDVSPGNPFALLSTPVGRDVAGALEFLPVDAEPGRDEGAIDWLSEDEIDERIVELVELNERAGVAPLGQFSLAGAQAKTAWRKGPDGRWGIPSGAEPTTHIIKPPLRTRPEHAFNEHVCLSAARGVGLLAARSEVLVRGGHAVVVVERYDRRAREGRLVRVHQEDLCQVFGVHPDGKYESDGGPNARAILRHFPTIMKPDAVRDARWRFVDALAFNWVMLGTDAHAKNYSLLLQGEQVVLAPLYDLGSVLPYDDAVDEWQVRMAMKIGRDATVKRIGSDSWRGMARRSGFDQREVLERVAGVVERTPPAFAAAADQLLDSGDVPRRGRDLAEKLVERVEERARRLARGL